ncbi:MULTISPECIES: glycosyltransferase family 4 protein [unclassified Butyrivibrio]|uniref:glycosyltransferase family 4 protein n=1 Tax=unclassified Butyrivibrio TaxID=2639466 RepID=UPI000677DCA6|nr:MULTISPECIES: glycosyltransferase family 4 protein [unclassified Butyrivibrio]SEM26970.1 Glycosyltransferase involved in cell wall bisynthesis [Butyrivibrio sp. ob235]
MVRKILKLIFPYIFREHIRGVLFKVNYPKIKRKECDFNTYPAGINLIGYARGDFGLGESCRLVAEAIKTSGIPFSIKNLFQNKNASETNMSYAQYESEDLKYNVNLIHVNPNEIVNFSLHSKRSDFDNRYQIAFWLWELPEFPQEWVYQIDMFDEIWTPSEFVSDAVRRVTSKPVHTVPYAMREPATLDKCDRDYFGIPADKFLYLMSYDGLSNSDRKNPDASIAAYKAAFPTELPDVGLIIKATHAGEAEMEHLRELMAGYENVYILTDSFSKEEFNSLIKCADAHISLHRSEGFGLVMAEAMFLGTPTVATNWSANAEFMSEDACCMVPVKIIEIEKETPPYHKGNHWADPDVHAASEFIRRLHDDKDFYNHKKTAAMKHIRERMSPERAAGILRERFAELTRQELNK